MTRGYHLLPHKRIEKGYYKNSEIFFFLVLVFRDKGNFEGEILISTLRYSTLFLLKKKKEKSVIFNLNLNFYI